jgi:hypothetical protein
MTMTSDHKSSWEDVPFFRVVVEHPEHCGRADRSVGWRSFRRRNLTDEDKRTQSPLKDEETVSTKRQNAQLTAHPVELETTTGEFRQDIGDSERGNATHHVESGFKCHVRKLYI